MKIYTRTGDQGETGLFGGARVKKNAYRVDAYGTIDELNAVVGVARAANMPDTIARELELIQNELFVIGAEVACVPDQIDKLKMNLVGSSAIKALEELIDEHEEELPELKTFVLPAGSPAAAALHHARTVARRAERRLLDLDELRSEVLIYLNRLSDCLFVLARRVNQLQQSPETPWIAPKG